MITVTARKRRSLLTRTLALEATMKIDSLPKSLDMGMLLSKTIAAFEGLLPEAFFEKQWAPPRTVLNICGRPRTAFSDHDLIPLPAEGDEELLGIAGEVIHPEQLHPEEIADDDDLKEVQPPRRVGFAVSYVSRFSAFDREGIAYSLHRDFSSSLKPIAPLLVPETIPSIEALRVTNFRVGIQNFAPTWIGSSVGLSPAVYRYLFLEISPLLIQLSLKEERLRSSSPFPFYDKDLIPRIEQSFHECGITEKIELALRTEFSKN